MVNLSTSLPLQLVYFTVGLQACSRTTSKTAGKLNASICLATACSTCMT